MEAAMRAVVRMLAIGAAADPTGTVGTWLQRETAEGAAANAPGIRHVHNNVTVVPPPSDTGEDELC
jgi:BON domain-containing protein